MKVKVFHIRLTKEWRCQEKPRGTWCNFQNKWRNTQINYMFRL